MELEATSTDTFDVMFAAQRDYVYKLAYVLLRNSQDAEDITQEVFLRVYKALPQRPPERASMRTWLTKLVVNACHTHRRRNFLRTLFANSDNDDETLNLADPSLWGRLKIRRLRLEHRTALILRYYLAMPCAEIA